MTATNSFPIPGPLQFTAWLDKNAASLQPPVNNKCLYSGDDFILWQSAAQTRGTTIISTKQRCVVDIPRLKAIQRGSDMNCYASQEWFYQIKGDMLLKIVENGHQFRDIAIKEGEMFLLPGNVPHSPRRQRNTIGLVMERSRPAGSIDHLRWYCENEKEHGEIPTIIREEKFYCENMETQLKDVIEDWMRNERSRECKSCGSIAAAQ